MEIHAPHAPTLTLKEALVHLCIVTVGILIALSLEGGLEWFHHRTLVEEAKTNLNNEIQDNAKEVERVALKVDTMVASIADTIGSLDNLSTEQGVQRATTLFRPGADVFVVVANYDRAQLSQASRTTAEITGAFGFMEYADVKKYARAYDQQTLYDDMQRQALDRIMAAYGTGLTLDFAKAQPGEIDEIKQQLRLAIGALAAVAEFGHALSTAYTDALGASN